jgi:hypothetical protein
MCVEVSNKSDYQSKPRLMSHSISRDNTFMDTVIIQSGVVVVVGKVIPAFN